MDDSKRYYWLKLKEDFFEDDTIQWLEEQENGKEYTLFYLKLCLKSLSLDGKIVRIVGETLIPYDKKALAKVTNTDLDTVTVAMNLFVQIGLIDIMDTGAIYMKQIDEMVGSETNAAIRKRKYRQTIEQGDNVPKLSQRSPTENRDKSLESREKSLEKEKHIVEKPVLLDPEKQIPYQEIIDYLNDKAETAYKPTSKKTQSLIKTRWDEGFHLEDFKKVIDNKVAEWSKDTYWSKFLRPETLFSNKFEGYLNQKTKVRSGGYDTGEYDDFF